MSSASNRTDPTRQGRLLTTGPPEVSLSHFWGGFFFFFLAVLGATAVKHGLSPVGLAGFSALQSWAPSVTATVEGVTQAALTFFRFSVFCRHCTCDLFPRMSGAVFLPIGCPSLLIHSPADGCWHFPTVSAPTPSYSTQLKGSSLLWPWFSAALCVFNCGQRLGVAVLCETSKRKTEYGRVESHVPWHMGSSRDVAGRTGSSKGRKEAQGTKHSQAWQLIQGSAA